MDLTDPTDVAVAAASHLPGLLVATDFDGTLAPIVADPEASRPIDGAIAALSALARRGAHVGVITGRDALTAIRLGDLTEIPRVVVEGLYGAERWRAGTLVTPDTPDAIADLRLALPELLAAANAAHGVWIEDKRLSLVIHTRRLPDPISEQQRLVAPAKALAERLGIDLHEGRGVLEFRLPGYDKGTALRRLISEANPSAVLFAGDDLGDVSAFDAVRAAAIPGWSVLVASAETEHLRDCADLSVDSPDGFVALLRSIAES